MDKKYLFFVILIVLISIFTLFSQNGNSSPNAEAPSSVISSEPTPDPNDVYHQTKGERLMIDQLSLSIPKDWYYYKAAETFQIHHELVDVNKEIPPAFLISLIREIDVTDVEKNIISNIQMTEVSTSSATIAGKPAIKMKGRVPEAEGITYYGPMLLTLIINGSDVYIFHDLAQLENHEQYYQQMLNSMRFGE